ncbi:hypothetical protein ACJ73_06720 [Blastomyces percursus]|uniref:Protein kinase domain-containing protein n=1 Tax=Blastomyces percursus TaxID=1658174 RepID=A0A1J9QP09_9EURO|nr:hypothetical protein ACJ73_06720 [Blastomyces percursus]
MIVLSTQLLSRERPYTPLERCIRHFPLEGSDGSTTADLEIIDAIRTGDNHSAQLVTVQVKRDDADPFLCVDWDYSHEVATYKALSKLYGTIIPRYFGSFTLKWSVDNKTTRAVRLILIEIVTGTSMQQLKPTGFSQLQRQAIMKAVIDAETLLYTHNIRHGDMPPRNILVLNSTEASNGRRVVIVGFGKILCWENPISRGREISSLGRDFTFASLE